jgi:hypothetical protein
MRVRFRVPIQQSGLKVVIFEVAKSADEGVRTPRDIGLTSD